MPRRNENARLRPGTSRTFESLKKELATTPRPQPVMDTKGNWVSAYHQGAAIEHGLEQQVAIPRELQHHRTQSLGRFAAPVFIFGHSKDPRSVLSSYTSFNNEQNGRTCYFIYGPYDEEEMGERFAHSRSFQGLNAAIGAVVPSAVVEISSAFHNRERYQMSALGALLLFTAKQAVENIGPVTGLDSSLRIKEAFDHPRLEGTHIRTYGTRCPDIPKDAMVMFNPTAKEHVSLTAGLISDKNDPRAQAGRMYYDQIPFGMTEPVLASVNQPVDPQTVEGLATIVAQMSFAKAAWSIQ